MKKLIFVFGVLAVLALSSCNKTGCPNQIEVEQNEIIVE